MKKYFLFTIRLICVVIICISSYNIYTTLSEYKRSDNIYSEIRNLKEAAMTEAGEDEIEDENVKLSKELSKKNSDYRCWINVQGTNIDYPIVQGRDNSYYLTHDFNKGYLPAGSIFMDYRNDLKKDLNTVIYGHHMRNSTMFGQLEKFKKKEFFEENKRVMISTKEGTQEYEVFAIGIFKADFGYNKVDFGNKEEYEAFLNKIKENALFKRDIVSSEDQIITLSTCSYEFDNARTALFAVKI